MFKRFLLVLSLLVAMPALANAWSVNAKAMTTGGTITPSGISTYGTLVVSAPFTVTAAAGKVIDKVKIDNVDTVAAPGTTTGVYTVNKGTASTHTILAFFKADAASVGATVNVTQPANGSISATYLVNGVKTPIPAAGIPVGATVVVKAMPATADYKVATITANSSDIQGAGPFSGGVAVTKTFTAGTGPNTVSATMEAAPVVRTAALTANKNTTTINGTDLILDATGSVTVGTPVYVFNVADKVEGTDYNLVDLNPAVNGKKIFTPLTAGAFYVTVTVTSGNAMTSTPAFAISALTSLAVQNQVCTNCHNGRDPQLVEEYALSGHAAGLYGHSPIGCQDCHFPGSNEDHPGAINTANIISINTTPAVANKCAECHTGIHSLTTQVANFAKSSHANSTHMTGISCGSCHGGHQFRGATFAGESGDCQSCHRPGSPYGIYSSNLVGKAPHFQTGTADVGGYYPTSSFITEGGATCSDCHGHNNSVNAGWAEGGHGSLTAAAWVSNASHNWNGQGSDNINYTLSPQKTNCIRCHTSRGFAQYWDSGFSNINKIYLADGVTVDKASAPLTCNGCHTSAEGALRAMPTGFTKVKSFYGYSTVAIAPAKMVTSLEFTDNKNSNICLPCHSQRAAGVGIKALFAQGAYKQYSAGTRIYPHEAQPAAIVDGKGGYEFSGGSFAYQDRMRHIRIGNYGTDPAGYNGTGNTSGNCAGCHMTSEKSHSLEVLSKDVNGNFTGIISDTCAKCHPASFTYQDVQAKKAEFDAAVTVLGQLLVNRGFTQDGTTVIGERKDFDMSKNAAGVFTKDNAIAEKNMGAWFNWYLFKVADKAGYAHNPAYSRRLINDSIDWLDDNAINGSSAATVQALAVSNSTVVTPTVKTDAIAQLNNPGCMGCHFGTGGVIEGGEVVPGIEQAPHMNTGSVTLPTGTVTKAQYVSTNAQCNNCHGYGHGTDSPGGTILADFAESGHGDTAGEGWAHYDFKQSNRAACQQCHTTTGFVKYVTGGFKMATAATSWGSTADTTKEVLACNACHSSTAWKTSVRTFATYSAPYGAYNSKYTASTSNLCIVCHSGQANMSSVQAKYATDPDNANVGLVNTHYLAAATTLYKTSGFKFYTDPAKYNNPSYFKHDKLGMNNYSSVSYDKTDPANWVRKYSYSQNTGTTGPCVGCHLNGTVGGVNGNSHSFSPIKLSQSMPASTGPVATPPGQGCYGCHATENMETLIEEEKEGFHAALNLLKAVFASNGVDYDPNWYPYFFGANTDHTVRDNGTTNWTFMNTRVANANALRTHGAAFNLNLLSREPGAFAHNRVYTKRLIYDSLNYLQSGVDANGIVSGTVNFSNFSSAKVPVSAARTYLGAARP